MENGKKEAREEVSQKKTTMESTEETSREKGSNAKWREGTREKEYIRPR